MQDLGKILLHATIPHSAINILTFDGNSEPHSFDGNQNGHCNWSGFEFNVRGTITCNRRPWMILKLKDVEGTCFSTLSTILYMCVTDVIWKLPPRRRLTSGVSASSSSVCFRHHCIARSFKVPRVVCRSFAWILHFCNYMRFCEFL